MRLSLSSIQGPHCDVRIRGNDTQLGGPAPFGQCSGRPVPTLGRQRFACINVGRSGFHAAGAWALLRAVTWNQCSLCAKTSVLPVLCRNPFRRQEKRTRGDGGGVCTGRSSCLQDMQ